MPADEGFQLDAATRSLLENWVQSSPRARLVRRSRIILLLSSGRSQASVAAQLGISRRTVALWRERFAEGGPGILEHDRPGRGRPKGRRPDVVAAIRAAMSSPPSGRERWSARELARQIGVSHSTVLRVWRDDQV